MSDVMAIFFMVTSFFLTTAVVGHISFLVGKAAAREGGVVGWISRIAIPAYVGIVVLGWNEYNHVLWKLGVYSQYHKMLVVANATTTLLAGVFSPKSKKE